MLKLKGYHRGYLKFTSPLNEGQVMSTAAVNNKAGIPCLLFLSLTEQSPHFNIFIYCYNLGSTKLHLFISVYLWKADSKRYTSQDCWLNKHTLSTYIYVIQSVCLIYASYYYFKYLALNYLYINVSKDRLKENETFTE